MKNDCKDDSCDLSHCKRCGSHMMGGYIGGDVLCDCCKQEAEHDREFIKAHVTCTMDLKRRELIVYRNGKPVGEMNYINEQPTLKFWYADEALLTINDMEIVMDNWNQMLSM